MICKVIPKKLKAVSILGLKLSLQMTFSVNLTGSMICCLFSCKNEVTILANV